MISDFLPSLAQLLHKEAHVSRHLSVRNPVQGSGEYRHEFNSVRAEFSWRRQCQRDCRKDYCYIIRCQCHLLSASFLVAEMGYLGHQLLRVAKFLLLVFIVIIGLLWINRDV